MSLTINDSMSIEIVQRLFNEIFPFLKIEFFEREIKTNGTVNSKKIILNNQKKLKDFQSNGHIPHDIIINPEMSVAELEKEITNEYKLKTQVFRKSGNVWLEATVTDAWSLEEQNKQGKLITDQLTKQ